MKCTITYDIYAYKNMFIALEIIALPTLNMTHLISILKLRKLLYSLCEITAIFY